MDMNFEHTLSIFEQKWVTTSYIVVASIKKSAHLWSTETTNLNSVKRAMIERNIPIHSCRAKLSISQHRTQPIRSRSIMKNLIPHRNILNELLQSLSHLFFQKGWNGNSLWTVSYRRIAPRVYVDVSIARSIRHTTSAVMVLNAT